MDRKMEMLEEMAKNLNTMKQASIDFLNTIEGIGRLSTIKECDGKIKGISIAIEIIENYQTYVKEGHFDD